MVKEIFLKNKCYISSKAAGARSGFTHDYISRLARKWRISAERFGRSWYVEEESLREFLLENNNERAKKIEKLAEERREEYFNASQHSEPVAASEPSSTDELNVSRVVPAQYEAEQIYVSFRPLNELFKKSVALTISVSLVFGSYFISSTSLGYDIKDSIFGTLDSTVALVDEALVGIVNTPDKLRETFEPLALATYKLPEAFAVASVSFGSFAYSIPAKLVEDSVSYGRAIGETAVIFFAGGYSEGFENFALNIVESVARISSGAFEVIVQGLDEYTELVKNVGGGIASLPQQTVSFGRFIKDTGNFAHTQITPRVLNGLSVTSSQVFESRQILSGLSAQVADFSTDNIFSIAKNLFGNTRRSLSRLLNNSEIPITTIQKEGKEDVVFDDTNIAQAPTTVPRTVISNPVVERVIIEERLVSGISEALLTERLSQLNNKLSAQIYSLSGENTTQIINNYSAITASNKIDDLGSVTIHDSTFSDGTISNSSVGGTNGTFSGTLTVNEGVTINAGLSVANVISVNGIATSSIAGSFTVDTDTFVVASSTNRIGIGTTSPGAKLSVAGNGIFDNEVSADYFLASSTIATSTFRGSLAVGTETFFVDSINNRVGVGTSSPFTDLAVQGDGYFSGNLTVAGFTATSSSQATFFTATSESATSTFAGGLTVDQNIGIATTSSLSGILSIENITNDYSIYVTDQAGDTSPFVIDADGNVGVGTSTPGVKLSVFGAGLFNNQLSADYFIATSTIATSTFAGGLTIQTSGFVYDYSTNNVGIGTSSPSVKLSVAGDILGNQIYGERFTATSTTAISTFAGLLSIGSSTPEGKLTVQNTGTGNSFIVEDQASDTTPFVIDASGQVGVGTTSPSTTFSVLGNGYFTGGVGIGVATTATGVLETSGDVYVGGNLHTVGDSTTLGASSADTLTINSTINSDLIPDINASRDIGSSSFFWDDGFFDSITANNISAASTTIAGTQSATFTINSDNATADTENAEIIFFRGTIVPNGLLTWDATNDRFDFNQPLYIQNDSDALNIVSLDVVGTAGQTADLLQVSSSTTNTFFNVTSSGFVGIGTSTPYATLSVVGETVSDIFTATSTTATSTFAGGLAIETTGFVYDFSTNYVGIGTSSPIVELHIDGVGGVIIPVGTTAQRPTTQVGTLRYNTTISTFEGYNGSAWSGLGGVIDVDQDTYILAESSSGADEDVLFFFTAGSEKARFTTAGNFGIGTTSPGVKLSVAGDILGNQIYGANFIATSTTATSTLAGGLAIETTGFVYDFSSNNVGIGTAAPTSLLSLQSAGAGSQSFFIIKDSNDTNQLFAGSDGDGDARIEIYDTSGGLDINLEAADDSYFNTGFSLGVGSTTPEAKLTVQNTGSGNSFIVEDSASDTTPFVIDASGNVGIGTVNPSTLLQVESSVLSSILVQGGSTSGIDISIDSTQTGGRDYAIQSTASGSGAGAGKLVIRDDDASGAVRFAIDSSGNIGISSTSPEAKLTVQNTGTGNSFIVEDSADDTTPFIIDESGNVGIGDISPDYNLDVTGLARFTGLVDASHFVATSSTATSTFQGGLTVGTTGSDFVVDPDGRFVGIGTAGPKYKLQISGTSETNFVPLVLSSDQIGNNGATVEMRFGYSDDVNQKGAIIFESTGANGEGDLHIALNSAADATNASLSDSVVTFANNGKVGIGTTSPFAKLSIENGVGASGPLFAIASSTSGTATTTHFIIDEYGRVGIGTTTPTETFSVAGDVYIGGTGTSTIENNLHVLDTLQVGTGSTYINNSGISFSAIDNIATTSTDIVASIIYNVADDPHPDWYENTTAAKARVMAITAASTTNASYIEVFDLTDPTTPVIQNVTIVGEHITSLDAAMGYLIVGTDDNGVHIYNWHDNTFATTSTGWPKSLNTGTVPALTDNNIVAVTAGFSDQPVSDPRTGGPKPTFAVGYGAGVDIVALLKDDGNVYNKVGTISGDKGVGISEGWFYSERDTGVEQYGKITDISADDFAGNLVFYPTSWPYGLGTANGFDIQEDFLVAADTDGLTLEQIKSNTSNQSAPAAITTTYNTGYMLGDIRGAWLSNSDITDRSYKANTLTENGTVTEGAVESGAELKGYSGFSASNYLNRAYDADFDFGTGDFSAYGWFKLSGGGTDQGLLWRADSILGSTARFTININTNNNVSAGIFDGTSADNFGNSEDMNDGDWHFIVLSRTTSKAALFVDGVEVDSNSPANSGDMDNGTAFLRLGLDTQGNNPADKAEMSLWRISATAPTASQVRTMYEAEKGMFVANSKVLLQGAADAVQTVSIDPVTEEVYVGQADSLQVWDGLVMKEELLASGNTWTSDDIQSVSAYNGSYVLTTASETYISTRAIDVRSRLVKEEGPKNLFQNLNINGILNASRIGGTLDNSILTIGAGGAQNSFMSQGLTINSGSATDEALALKATGLSTHGLTTLADTDTFGKFELYDTTANKGGLLQGAYAGTSATIGYWLDAVAGTDVTTKTGTGGRAYINLQASKANGTGKQSPGANANLLSVSSGSAADVKLILDQEGDLHLDGSATVNTFDLAEYIRAENGNADIRVGTILSTVGNKEVATSTGAYDTSLIGIASDPQYALKMGSGLDTDTSDDVLVGMSGTLEVLVNDENGSISSGDYVTSSSIAGIGMKATKSGMVVGRAYEDWNQASSTVHVVIGTHYRFGDDDLAIDGSTGHISMAVATSTNVGIGTTTPEYKLHVIGDVAATSFVNISTGELKTDISYLNEQDDSDILDKINALQVAKYRYTVEDPQNPLRLGLIAEEAPAEVLSIEGKGVDIYKLATFTLAGVQALAENVNKLELRVAALESSVLVGGGATSTPSTGAVSTTIDAVIDYLAGLGANITEGIAYFTNLVANTLTVGSQEKPSGITLYDENTGAPYCLKIVNGSVQNISGVCTGGVDGVVTTVGTTTPSGDIEAPVFTIMGNNPATIAVGASYLDPGATVTDNVNTNLGFTYLLDGVSVSSINIDTSTDKTYTITYSATDQAGNTGTAIRTVVVGAGTTVPTSTSTVAEETTPETTTTTEETTATTTPEVVIDTTPDTTATTTPEVVAEETTTTPEVVIEDTTATSTLEVVAEETTATTTPETSVDTTATDTTTTTTPDTTATDTTATSTPQT